MEYCCSSVDMRTYCAAGTRGFASMRPPRQRTKAVNLSASERPNYRRTAEPEPSASCFRPRLSMRNTPSKWWGSILRETFSYTPDHHGTESACLSRLYTPRHRLNRFEKVCKIAQTKFVLQSHIIFRYDQTSGPPDWRNHKEIFYGIISIIEPRYERNLSTFSTHR